MKEASNELENLISTLNLGSMKMLIEEYVQLAREEIVDAEYNMDEFVDLARERGLYLGSNLNEKPMEGNDMDNQQTQIASSSMLLCLIH